MIHGRLDVSMNIQMATSEPNENEHPQLCEYCSETFTSPKILPCLHTFCENCIHAVITSAGKDKVPKIAAFLCPLCRTKVTPIDSEADIEYWAAALKDNLNISSKSNKTENLKCDWCKKQEKAKESLSKFWCSLCEESFCESCSNFHSRLKCTSSHSVVSVCDKSKVISPYDLSVVTGSCVKHPKRLIETYCNEHKVPCCLLCNTTHRRCENIKPIDEIKVELCEKYRKALTESRDSITNLLQSKRNQKASLKGNIDDVEDKARKLVEHLKCEIDSMFETFGKKLHIFKDEKQTKLNVQIRLLERFVSNTEHWISTTDVLREKGTPAQLFNHFETMKRQINLGIDEVGDSCREDNFPKLNFEKDPFLAQFGDVQQIGSFTTKEISLVDQMNVVDTACLELGINSFPKIENFELVKEKEYFLENEHLRCGCDISMMQFLVGGRKNIYLIDKESGSTVCKLQISGVAKGLCYHKASQTLLFSCQGDTRIYNIAIDQNIIGKPNIAADFDNKIGSLACDGDQICAVIDDAVYIMNFSNLAEIVTKIETNTELDVTSIDIQNSLLFISTFDHEVKCLTLAGETVFNFRTEDIQKPTALKVICGQYVLTVNATYGGSLNIISCLNKDCRQVLEEFQKVTTPTGIWVNGKTVYVCGISYIEVYKLVFNRAVS